jgi:hypothetical protein
MVASKENKSPPLRLPSTKDIYAPYIPLLLTPEGVGEHAEPLSVKRQDVELYMAHCMLEGGLADADGDEGDRALTSVEEEVVDLMLGYAEEALASRR